MSCVGGKHLVQSCENCLFWTKHKPEGTCSQKVKTSDNLLVNRVTFADDICNSHSDDNIKSEFKLFISKDNEVSISGTCNKNTLLYMKEYLEQKIKAF